MLNLLTLLTGGYIVRLSEFDEVMGLTTQQLQSSIIKLGLRNGKWKNSEWLMTWQTDRRAICSDKEEHMTFYKSRFNLCILETLEQSVYSTWKEALSRRSPSTQISRDLDRLSPRNPCNGVVICFGGDLKRGSLPTAYFFPRCQRIRGSFWAIIRARENKIISYDLKQIEIYR